MGRSRAFAGPAPRTGAGTCAARSRRTLPLPDRLVSVLKAAKARQAARKACLSARPTAPGAYVVSNEIGEPVLARGAVPLLA